MRKIWEHLKPLLAIHEEDLPRVELVLYPLWCGSLALAIIFTTVALIIIMAGDLQNWMVVGPIFLVVLIGLRKLQQLEYKGLAFYLLLIALILFLVSLESLGHSLGHAQLLLYAVPVAVVSFSLTPAAGLLWAGVVVLILALRMLIWGEAVAIEVWGGQLVGLGGMTAVLWFLGRLREETERNLTRYIRQGRASIEIGHTVTATGEASTIIGQTVGLIQEAFGYYHVSFFQYDTEAEVATLTEAAGGMVEGLLTRGVTVTLSGNSVVSVALRSKSYQTMVAWRDSVGTRGRSIEFTYRYKNFPTRAEMALPLIAQEQILGVLDIHSTELDPFTEEQIHALEGLLGNVANAIVAARLLAGAQRRHDELENVYHQTTRRARYLEVTAELAKAISQLLEPEQLLREAVTLISNSLGFYHAGIFLLDETEEWAVLAAANSAGGQRMLARRHRLRVGEQGIVGWVTATGKPRIALDVGADAVHFDNPDLPDTRSELALLLQAGDERMGALDVQSQAPGAFNEEDVAVLQTLADQIAIAISNARLYQQGQKALLEVKAVQRYYLMEEWEKVLGGEQVLKAEYQTLGVTPLEVDWTPEMERAWSVRAPVMVSESRDKREAASTQSALAVPIMLQDEVLGAVEIQELDEERSWTAEEISLVTDVVGQLSLAIENARLFEQTQRALADTEYLYQASEALNLAQSYDDILATLRKSPLLQQADRNISLNLFDVPWVGDEVPEWSIPIARWTTLTAGATSSRYPLRKFPSVSQLLSADEVTVITDVVTDPRLDDQARALYAGRFGAQGTVFAPLVVGGHWIGYLNAIFGEELQVSEDEVRQLMALASQAAVAVQNRAQLEASAARARRERMIREISEQIQSASDVQGVLETAARELGRALRVSRTSVQLGEWRRGGGKTGGTAPLRLIPDTGPLKRRKGDSQ
ncbi:MAG TPA: GAF domain-containing protein [Thermoflexia bacterium]|nr:GAF domain-containing protein [Thermoflexia bacterium]